MWSTWSTSSLSFITWPEDLMRHNAFSSLGPKKTQTKKCRDLKTLKRLYREKRDLKREPFNKQPLPFKSVSTWASTPRSVVSDGPPYPHLTACFCSSQVAAEHLVHCLCVCYVSKYCCLPKLGRFPAPGLKHTIERLFRIIQWVYSCWGSSGDWQVKNRFVPVGYMAETRLFVEQEVHYVTGCRARGHHVCSLPSRRLLASL